MGFEIRQSRFMLARFILAVLLAICETMGPF